MKVIKLLFSLIIFFSTASSALCANVLTTKKIIYGKSTGHKNLIAHVHLYPGVKHSKAIIMTDGVHGNEYLGLVDELSNMLTKGFFGRGISKYFLSGGVIITIPKVNPDGIKLKKRNILTGRDLNRTFLLDSHSNKEKAVEGSSLVSFVSTFLKTANLKLLFAVDYHCCGGAGLLPSNSNGANDFYEFLGRALRKNIHDSYVLKNTEQVFGKRFIGTLKDYWHNSYGIPSITFEAKTLDESRFSGKHMRWWGKTLDYISLNSMPSTQIVSDLSKRRFWNKVEYLSSDYTYSE